MTISGILSNFWDTYNSSVYFFIPAWHVHISQKWYENINMIYKNSFRKTLFVKLEHKNKLASKKVLKKGNTFLVQLQLNWKTVLNITNFWIWMEGLAWKLRTKGQDFHHSIEWVEFQQGKVSGTFKVDTIMNLMTSGKRWDVKHRKSQTT